MKEKRQDDRNKTAIDNNEQTQTQNNTVKNNAKRERRDDVDEQTNKLSKNEVLTVCTRLAHLPLIQQRRLLSLTIYFVVALVH